ncbi:presqualene diphosphate synthase HpnD [Stenoxybacter acetivorans]|uniref:presqualene diphosphate synthase HpnD n=1 Tax=Stenoxybacter acetivorans TaxID=422441 RepID=UPI00055D6FA4|nr:presqualene diphosphate synthase HpnD [Stenoxybacter acetivorans]
MQALEYCQFKAEQSGSSFLAGFRFLPKPKREAMMVLYAYCRELDDVVDDCTDATVAAKTLDWWRLELAKAFNANAAPEHPITQALRPVAAVFRLPESEFTEIIDGMYMDLAQTRYATFDDLRVYCRRVAGAVGCLIARILGFSEPQTLQYADHLGLALQLTNIIRDVGEDARLGRIYLPLEDLQHFDVPATVILNTNHGNAAFTKLMQFQVERARACYRESIALLPAVDVRKQKAGLIMGAIYYALLREIDADGAGNVLHHKLALPGRRKLSIALKTWLWGFKP